MEERNLPVKLVIQRAKDNVKNLGGGDVKFFGEFSADVKAEIISELEEVLGYYTDVFQLNENMPAVGKITVKPEAIAKSHKPNELCRNCPIIGSEDLDEIYIKVTRKGLRDTIGLVNNPPSVRFAANLTTILNIEPIKSQGKISPALSAMKDNEIFDAIKDRVKVKLFSFDNEYDDTTIREYVKEVLEELGLDEKVQWITYGDKIEYIKVEVESFEDIEKIASINGVKSIDFFQEYSLPIHAFDEVDLEELLNEERADSDTVIGIIDGGISPKNELLAPYVIEREEYISEEYQNHEHATFIASTIQYGNKLNGIAEEDNKLFKFVDIVAIPNSEEDVGATDVICEDELMEIIEDAMEKYSDSVHIWNLSLGVEALICNGAMSDFGIFLDYIQDKYAVQFLVSSGNLNSIPLRTWPPQENMGERDRIISPADSIRALTVGAIALYESDKAIVRSGEPSPFSRRGPGANYTIKPDVVDYGGNIDINHQMTGLGMVGLNCIGQPVENIGTSFSAPRVTRKFTNIYDELVEKDLLLTKALIIHSARMQSRELLDENREHIKYFGFGMPAQSSDSVLQCSKNEITLVFRQKLVPGSHLEMIDFPFPQSLIRNGKYRGEIAMTLAYNPPLNQQYGREYCRTNIDVSFGTYQYLGEGKMKFHGQVPMETTWDEMYEQARVEHGFKWNPIKSYYRNIVRGVNVAQGWKIRIDLVSRNNLLVDQQEFVLIMTLRDAEGHDIYSEVVNGLREKGYITNNLETQQQIRQRQ